MNARKHRVLGLLPVALLLALGCAVETGESGGNLRTAEQPILGGGQATPGEYPWMAQISQFFSGSDSFVPNCGGSLIAKRWVLTAAHCLRENPGASLVPVGDLRVTLGEHDLASSDGSEQVIPVAAVYTHPGYSTPTIIVDGEERQQQGINDVGLIELASDAQLNARVQIVRLATGDDGPVRDTWLSGWGATESLAGGGPEPPILKELWAQVVDPTYAPPDSGSCNDGVRNTYWERQVRSDELCMLNPDTNPGFDPQSGCFGDSGSSWIVKRASGCVEQVGVHSWGNLYCAGHTVAQRVSSFLGWIHEIVDDVYEAESITHTTGTSHPGGWNLYDNNGYAAFSHTFSGGQQQLVVRASGQNGNGWPNLQVRVNGTIIGNQTVSTTSWTDYAFSFNAPVGNAEVRIYFTNDYYQPPVDRNLFIDKVTVVNVGQQASCAPTPPGSFSASLDVYDDWGAGYCARVRLTNAASVPTTGWTVVVNSGNSSVTGWWNTSSNLGTGNHTLVPVGWNAAINAGVTNVDTGFCANRAPGTTTQPTIVSATATY